MNSQNLILVGRGRFGREVASWIKVLNLPFKVVGFIDDVSVEADVVGKIQNHEPRKDHVYLTCFGSGPDRQKIRTQLEGRGARFATLIDPAVRTATSLTESTNSIFLGTIGISNDVSVGDNLLLHAFASIGHDVKLGNGVTVNSHGFVGGGAILEECCTIHPNAVVLPDVIVGRYAVVGAGAVAIRDVKANSTVFGSPAKPL